MDELLRKGQHDEEKQLSRRRFVSGQQRRLLQSKRIQRLVFFESDKLEHIKVHKRFPSKRQIEFVASQ